MRTHAARDAAGAAAMIPITQVLDARLTRLWDGWDRSQPDPLPRAARKACDALLQRRNEAPEAHVRSIDAEIMALLAPHAIAPLDIVRTVVGRRSRISRGEMAAILVGLAARGMDLPAASTIVGRFAGGEYHIPGAPGSIRAYDHAVRETAAAWARACTGITCVSVLPTIYHPTAEWTPWSGVDGRYVGGLGVRYDDPGSMHPGQHAEITFAPASLAERDEYDPIGYLRYHADRVLIVAGEPEPPTPPAPLTHEPETRTTVECDDGHRWETDDPDRDWQCSVCGGPWV